MQSIPRLLTRIVGTDLHVHCISQISHLLFLLFSLSDQEGILLKVPQPAICCSRGDIFCGGSDRNWNAQLLFVDVLLQAASFRQEDRLEGL